MVNREMIDANGTLVAAFKDNKLNTDFISLTDIAKYKNNEFPNDVIRNWLRSRNTIEYLGLWEQMNNNKFNNSSFNELLLEAGANSFVLSPTKWINSTNAIGLVSKPGRYGGTYAQVDIAFEFATWVSPEFKLYLIKDYQLLKKHSSSHLNEEWQVNRELSKINYRIHTDAIKDLLIPKSLTKKQAKFAYATEADRLNVALFGMTAKEWNSKHPNAQGNIRDNATLEQLTVLTNLESMNAELIKDKVPDFERTLRLNKMAVSQMETLLKNKKAMNGLKSLSNTHKQIE